MKDFTCAKLNIAILILKDLLKYFINLEHYNNCNRLHQLNNMRQNMPIEVRSFRHASNSQNYLLTY